MLDSKVRCLGASWRTTFSLPILPLLEATPPRDLLAYFLRAVDRFAQHIATLPQSVRSKIIASQAMYGTTGDDEPWHGDPVDPKQTICYTPEMKSCKRVGQFADEWHNVRERYLLELSRCSC